MLLNYGIEYMKNVKLSKNQLERLPSYLHLLVSLRNNGIKVISAQTIATCLDLNQEQVRKDIASVSSVDGVPNKGRDINVLIHDIEDVLGYGESYNAFLVGAGSLGKALLHYNGFNYYGMNIVCAFDKNKDLVGSEINGKPVLDIDELNYETLQKYKANIAILCVPQYAIKDIEEKLVQAKVEAIWNFVPTKLNVPSDIIVSNIDLATSLSVLSHKLAKKKKEGQ